MKNIFGYIGILLILVAYTGNTFGFIQSGTGLYQWMNLIGSLGIVVTAYTHRDNPSIILNIAWAVIAIISLFRI
jgi:hypothetical protein